MIQFTKNTFYFMLIAIAFSCNKDIKEFSQIEVSMQFDETQERLNNFGEPATIEAGHATQTPQMNSMSIHYLELSFDEFTPYKDGQIIFKAPETTEGGQLSIDSDSSRIAEEGEVFFTVNIQKVEPGTYNYLRASVAYQNYTLQFNLVNVPTIGDVMNQSGTVASFLGYRTYIRNLQVDALSIPIFSDKDQGFWAFETNFTAPYEAYNSIITGQAPEGATTVVNPLFLTSPVPAGSCVITGKLAEPLVITGEEIENLLITLSFSTNGSFEWVDTNGNGQWDIDATDAAATEQVIDMGIRGMLPQFEFKAE